MFCAEQKGTPMHPWCFALDEGWFVELALKRRPYDVVVLEWCVLMGGRRPKLALGARELSNSIFFNRLVCSCPTSTYIHSPFKGSVTRY